MMQEMRRWLTLVCEGKVERLPYQDFLGNDITLTLVWNPTLVQLHNFLDRSEDHMLRSLTVGNDLVAWDAYYVEHTDVGKLLDQPRPHRRLGYGLFYEKNGYIVFHAGQGGKHAHYAANPALQRLFAAGVQPIDYSDASDLNQPEDAS